MAILRILTIPDPALKNPAKTVGSIGPDTAEIIRDLIETMRHHTRCVGLAAPQAGISLAIVVVDVSLYPRKFNNHGQLVLINPKITETIGNIMGREGCLSVPDLTANVSRFEKITVEAMDENFNKIKINTSGFEAVVLQHEIDHLSGLLFLDRVTSLKTDVFRRKP
ncbi:MAG TPA: peptide deformylase [Elusimicrobia bacterium]|nr:MAG: peptide deformylase [Elusimicrobia bacterium RIFOXYA12_FULL_49_49]OGS09352.1 MAG: peptide deformylase [Elusimicrobia bacterium RIFOXYA1_FULL_47_7]OGS16042.1 MAG: peptide deformylase [Elusimicrobia bacterium RIFOXYA2_FULL_47_53]OGS25787.1 MAG: peptide deformylase [Elusimicrobia bacterium RIFOXYB12_FULL_50_12]OGS30206.1 MAG: peptide deformylase [Elusimicrobia bacterium RIFOXYB2_FULL_46_23]HBU69316.1 peptide deformylase [Elusimicrobiota bacterium]